MFSRITLCTFSSGSIMVEEVLDDWLEFLGGRPERVICAVPAQEEMPAIYESLRERGKIDEICRVGSNCRSVQEIEPEGVYRAVAAASTEWVILIKLDTLPYRKGNDNWLMECMDRVRDRGFFGMTGSFRPNDGRPFSHAYSSTQKYSNNFSIFRREDWLQIVPVGLCTSQKFIVDGVEYANDNIRFATEAAIEAHLRNTGKWMLTRKEDRDWSVFHVNVWGEKLRQVRDGYRRRIGLAPFLDDGLPPSPPLTHPWQWWYGTEPPPPLRRARIWLGEKMRGWRKKQVSGS